MTTSASNVEKQKMIHLNDRYTLPNAEALEVARETLEKMQSLNLNANPIHFALIYEWLSKIDPSFAKEVEQAIKFNTYSDDEAFKLFTELWARIVQTILPTNAFEEQVNILLNHVEGWIADAESHQSHLQDSLQEIQTIKNQPNLDTQTVFTKLEKEIQPEIDALVEDTHHLQANVIASKERIETLKDELLRANTIANTDELTNIPNRRGYRIMLEKAISEALDNSQTFAFLLIDIDYFKKINDTYGHLVGDSVLRYIAKLLYRETKGRDYIARIGGEEFVILLPNTFYDSALKVADSIRAFVANKPLQVKGHDQPLKLTISIGVAMYQLGEKADTLFERADKALYLAKESGRNQVKGETDL